MGGAGVCYFAGVSSAATDWSITISTWWMNCRCSFSSGSLANSSTGSFASSFSTRALSFSTLTSISSAIPPPSISSELRSFSSIESSFVSVSFGS